jgi:nucleotide-binding universal stress UspA family protein
MTFAIRSIVCAVDFSPASIAGLDRAILLGVAHNARVQVVHAYVVPPVPFVESGIMTIDEERLRRALEIELRGLIAKHAPPSFPIDARVIGGWPADAILFASKEARADLIVTGTRGLSRLPRFLVGSVAERIARTSRTPVLAVPEPTDEGGVRPIRTILCAVDFSPQSDAALGAAVALAAKHEAALHLVHVWEPAAFVLRHEDVAASYERDLIAQLTVDAERAQQGAAPISHVVRRGAPYAAIVDQAHTVGADLIVIGSTGKSGPRHFLLGSVAERVLRVSPVPVLIVRPA